MLFFKKILKILWASLFAVSLGYSVGKPIYVVGVLQDSETGEPIPFAEINTLSGKTIGKTTGSGRFELEVETKELVLIFTRHGYTKETVDLADYEDLINLDLEMAPSAKVLSDKRAFGNKIRKRKKTGHTTIEETEQYSGMKMDLNDHLRQIPGVSGMTEYSSDISIFGGRTEDVTHYLGMNSIANMRHLDFGFPGNQSVINPRLLKSVHLEDNLSSGPIGQGNSSALRYELKEGDPEKITGDVVVGTTNLEGNVTAYWDSITFVGSLRGLSPNFLSNLGKQYFTVPKEVRSDRKCTGEQCSTGDPINMSTLDLLTSIYSNQGENGYWRGFFLGAADYYQVREVLFPTSGKPELQVVQDGLQEDAVIAFEALSPMESGDLEYSFSVTHHENVDTTKDTSLSAVEYAFYGRSQDNQNDVKLKVMGMSQRTEQNYNSNWKWSPQAKVLNGYASYGVEMQYRVAGGAYKDLAKNNSIELDDVKTLLTNGLFRLKWKLSRQSGLASSIGWHSVGGERVLPIFSTRYNRKFSNQNTYMDISLRENTRVEPTGFNKIEAYTTSSVGLKWGLEGAITKRLNYTSSLYSRYYYQPILPAPEVYWNYEEKNKADYAAVFGANLYMSWEPSHHFGVNMNGSIVQGDYYLENEGVVPWEANRSLDFVSNLRFVPRKDSAVSFIITYTVNNDVPLYEYKIEGDNRAVRPEPENKGPAYRTIRQSKLYPTVSRQRTDIRLNLDKKSNMKPLDYIRFFIQGNNIFASADDGVLKWLGGRNEKQRGWTRISRKVPLGDLTPIIIEGLGFFWMFGVEGHVSF